MVHVRQMRMPVTQPHMPCQMRMRLAGRIVGACAMLMMLVVHMRMRMLQRFVLVIVLMHLR